MANNIGKITQIIGAVLDIKFTEGNLPEINDAIKVPTRDGKELVVEVSQHLGDDIVRCIAMGSTDGLVRGMDAIATGAPISVPVGENTLGRMFNVLGNPIDEIDPPTGVETWPIHRKAPAFEEQATSQEMLETGIKVVDLLCPYQKGGKIGLFGGAGVGKTVLIMELMGKHSNIIFCDEKGMILDSIKHVSSHMSSVREVLPGRKYFIPNTANKHNPLDTDYERFSSSVLVCPKPLSKALCQTYTGISTCIAEEVCFRSGIDSNKPANCLSDEESRLIYNAFDGIMSDVKNKTYSPNIVYDNGNPSDFAAVQLTMYDNSTPYDSISRCLIAYYHEKEVRTRIHQKSTDIRRIVTTHLERSYKKLDIQEKQLKDTEKRDKYRVYGELINTYGYGIEPGAKQFNALNYYTNEEITIPLDNTLTPIENANKYFARYNKLKRTYEAGTRLIAEIKDEIMYLESIINALDIATTENDLNNIKEELAVTGYIKKSGKSKNKGNSHNKPMHYISSDGFDMYVGKNNIQNDELTFKFATGGDWWFHAKQMPGSHVIVKSDGRELPDKTYEEAAALAAYYSKGRDLEKVEVDYVLKKEVKKPAGAKPGFVVYYTNYSLIAIADISGIKLVSE